MIAFDISRGMRATVSSEDADLAALKWTASLRPYGRVYVMKTFREDGRVVAKYLHRIIAERMGILSGKHVVDHINGDSLDNRRENLRCCSQKENSRNIGGHQERNKVGYLGVTMADRATHPKWTARIGHNGKMIHIGCYDSPEEAYAARLAAERQLWGISPRRAPAHMERE